MFQLENLYTTLLLTRLILQNGSVKDVPWAGANIGGTMMLDNVRGNSSHFELLFITISVRWHERIMLIDSLFR
jgi:hypothetical protein